MEKGVTLPLQSRLVIPAKTPFFRVKVTEWHAQIILTVSILRFSSKSLTSADAFGWYLCQSRSSIWLRSQRKRFLLGSIAYLLGNLRHEEDLPSKIKGSTSHLLLRCSGSYKWNCTCQEPIILLQQIFSSLNEITRNMFTQAPSRRIGGYFTFHSLKGKTQFFQTFPRSMNILVCRAIIHRSIPVRLNQVLLFTAISKYNVGQSIKLIFFLPNHIHPGSHLPSALFVHMLLDFLEHSI